MCGGEVSTANGGDGGNSGDDGGVDGGGSPDGPLWDDVLRVPDCGQFAVVPGGEVYVGAWSWDAASGTYSPTTTCDEMNPGNKVLTVASFSLMDEPVTNVCYEECVKRGMCTAPTHDIADPNPLLWDDPSRASEPVYVDHDTAQSFCVWLGGHLPSIAQVQRASQGDMKVPSVPAMTAAAINCFEHPDPNSQICGQITQMNLSNMQGLYPVGQVAMDVGPYGHHDLYGEGYSWTESYGDFTEPKFCALQNGAPDYVTFDEYPQFAQIQWAVEEYGTFQGFRQTMNPGDVDPTSVTYQYSFRCAFDN